MNQQKKSSLSKFNPLSKAFFDRSFDKKNTPSTRGLKLESLENRELLSATTWESPAAVAADNSAFVVSVQSDMAPISLATLDVSVEKIEATPSAPGSNKANIEWTRVEGATKYYLMSSTSTDGENFSAWSGLKNVNDPGADSDAETVATKLTLTPGKYYKFKVRAVTPEGTTDFTETEDAIVATKPVEPTITSAAVDRSTGIATVEFDTVENASLYRVDYTFDDGVSWQFAKYVAVGEGEETASKIFIDADADSAVVSHKLNANKTYYFRVRATNDCGSSEYVTSDPISYKGAAAPETVTAEVKDGSHYATITWSASDGAIEYFIESTTNGGTSWGGVKKASAEDFTYDATTDTYSYSYFISTGKTYQYRVRAYNELGTDGNSTVSNEIALTVVGEIENFVVADAQAVNPTNYPIGERYSKVTLTLNWDAADNATKYVVEYAKDGGSWRLLKNINDPTVTSTTFNTVAGSYYNFRVRAVNSISTSENVETGVYGVYKAAFNRVDVVTGETLTVSTVAPAGLTTVYKWQFSYGDGEWYDVDDISWSEWDGSQITGSTLPIEVANDINVLGIAWVRVLVSGSDDDCPAGSYVAEAIAGNPDALNAPTDFVFGEYDQETHKLPMSWTDNSDNEDGFYVEYTTDGGQTWAKAAWLDANVTERVGAVYENKIYQFRVRAYNSHGYSDWAYSPEINTNFTTEITASGDKMTTLAANNKFAVGEVTYVWQLGHKENGEFVVDTTLEGNGATIELTGDETGVVRVIATDSNGTAEDDIALVGTVTLSGDYYVAEMDAEIVSGGGDDEDVILAPTGYETRYSEYGVTLAATVDGNDDGTFSYVWVVKSAEGEEEIEGVPTYVTTADDIDKSITVYAVGNGTDVASYRYALQTYYITERLDLLTTTITASGDKMTTLTANVAYSNGYDYYDADVTYVWERGHYSNGQFVVDATLEGDGSTIELTGRERGYIRVTVTDAIGKTATDDIALVDTVTLTASAVAPMYDLPDEPADPESLSVLGGSNAAPLASNELDPGAEVDSDDEEEDGEAVELFHAYAGATLTATVSGDFDADAYTYVWLVGNTVSDVTGSTFETDSSYIGKTITVYAVGNGSDVASYRYAGQAFLIVTPVALTTEITASGDKMTTLTATGESGVGDVTYVWERGHYNGDNFVVDATLEGNGASIELTGSETGYIRVTATDSIGQTATDDIALVGTVTLASTSYVNEDTPVDDEEGEEDETPLLGAVSLSSDQMLDPTGGTGTTVNPGDGGDAIAKELFMSEAGATLTATVAGDFDADAYTYVWYVNNTVSDVTTSTFKTDMSHVGQTITVTVIGNGTDVASYREAGQIAHIVAPVNPMSVTITASGDKMTTLTANVENAKGDVEYSWLLLTEVQGGGLMYGEVRELGPGQTITLTGNEEGVIVVWATDSIGQTVTDDIALVGNVFLTVATSDDNGEDVGDDVGEDDGGEDLGEPIPANIRGAVTLSNDAGTGAVVDPGTADPVTPTLLNYLVDVDEILNVTVSGTLTSDKYTYVWVFDDGVNTVEVVGGPSYTTTTNDIDKTISVYVVGNGTDVASYRYAPQTYTVKKQPPLSVTITASGDKMTTLTANVENATGDVEYSWQLITYVQNGGLINGEVTDLGTGQTITLTGDEKDGVVVVSAIDAADDVASDEIMLAGNVTLSGDYYQSIYDPNTGAEDRFAEPGVTLTATVYSLAESQHGNFEDGTYSYVWYVNGQVSANTGNTYVTTNDDYGKTITVEVIGNGTDVASYSRALQTYVMAYDVDPNLIVTIPGDVVAYDGETSLREAILYVAQSDLTDAEITFAPWLKDKTITVTEGTLMLEGDLQLHDGTQTIDLIKNLTINGGELNITVSTDGGTIFDIYGDCDVEFKGLNFTNATEGNDGNSAIHVSTGANVTFNDCAFENCSANDPLFGGAVTLETTSVTTFNACYFKGNSSTSGGAVLASQSAIVTFNDCDFMDNTGDLGGAVYVTEAGRSFFNACIFTDNTGGYGGALNVDVSSDATITNSIFSGNYANLGGAIYAGEYDVYLGLMHVTIVDNTAPFGGGLFLDGVGTAEIFNSIIYGNHSDNGMNVDAYGSVINSYNTLTFHGNDSQGVESWRATECRWYDYDPVLMSNNDSLSSVLNPSTYELVIDSPAIDAGNPNLPMDVTTDLYGNTRDRKPDVGAVEYVYASDEGNDDEEVGEDELTGAVLDDVFAELDLDLDF